MTTQTFGATTSNSVVQYHFDHALSGGTNLSTQTITSPAQGLYRATLRWSQTADGTGSIDATVFHTNQVGADSQGIATHTMDTPVAASSWTEKSFNIWVESGNITYDTTGTWTGAGTLHVRIEAL